MTDTVRIAPRPRNRIQVFLSAAGRATVIDCVTALMESDRRIVINLDVIQRSATDAWSAPMTAHYAKRIGHALRGYGVTYLAQQFLDAAALLDDTVPLRKRSFYCGDPTWERSIALAARTGNTHSQMLRTLLDLAMDLCDTQQTPNREGSVTLPL